MRGGGSFISGFLNLTVKHWSVHFCRSCGINESGLVFDSISKENPSLYDGSQVMSVFLERRRPTLLQKVALSLSVTALKSPASELLPRVTKLISEKWQKSWNNCTGNKLQSISSTIGIYQHRSLSRCDAVITDHPPTSHRPQPVDSWLFVVGN